MRSRGLTLPSAATLVAALVLSTAAWAAGKGQETFSIINASFPEPGVMVAGQPTGEQVQLLAEEGYETIVDLREPDEPRGFDEREAARQNGLAYVNVPVPPSGPDDAAVDKFLDALRKAGRPAIVHCATGNRAGALWYAWLVLEKKVPPAQALARAKAAGLRQPELTAKVQKLVAQRTAAK